MAAAALAIEAESDGTVPTHSAASRQALALATRAAKGSAVDLEALHECAALLAGTHDFTAFTPTDTYHVRFDRQVYAAYWREREGGLLEFWIEADTFMRHMNRALVGTMLEVGRGRLSVGDFAELLQGRHRSAAGPTAPAHGLYLMGAGYEGQRLLA